MPLYNVDRGTVMSHAHMPSPAFLPGLELSRRFCAEAHPDRVLRADRSTRALTARIKDPDIRELRRARAVGKVVDSAEVLRRPGPARAAVEAVTGVDAHDGPPRAPTEDRRSQNSHRE